MPNNNLLADTYLAALEKQIQHQHFRFGIARNVVMDMTNATYDTPAKAFYVVDLNDYLLVCSPLDNYITRKDWYSRHLGEIITDFVQSRSELPKGGSCAERDRLIAYELNTQLHNSLVQSKAIICSLMHPHLNESESVVKAILEPIHVVTRAYALKALGLEIKTHTITVETYVRTGVQPPAIPTRPSRPESVPYGQPEYRNPPYIEGDPRNPTTIPAQPQAQVSGHTLDPKFVTGLQAGYPPLDSMGFQADLTDEQAAMLNGGHEGLSRHRGLPPDPEIQLRRESTRPNPEDGRLGPTEPGQPDPYHPSNDPRHAPLLPQLDPSRQLDQRQAELPDYEP